MAISGDLVAHEVNNHLISSSKHYHTREREPWRSPPYLMMNSAEAEKPTIDAVTHDDLIDEEEIIPDHFRPLKAPIAHGRRLKQSLTGAKASALVSNFDGEPLIDTTVSIPLHSKRTERLEKKSKRKSKKTIQSNKAFLVELPWELLIEILSFLRPSDAFALRRTSRSMRDFISQNEEQISQGAIRFRYPILTKCFPLPVLFDAVDKNVIPALLSSRHQQRLLIHKVPYQHIMSADPQNTCSCMSCVMAWNNLNLIIDIAHWQDYLSLREPITMIARGAQPQWNVDLITANASIVDNAISRPLWYARLLEKHLDTTTRTIVRHSKIYRKQGIPLAEGPVSKRLYRLSPDDIATGTDAFLQRSGPPSYEFPYHRDKYYTLGAYLPNRRWENLRWMYYGDLHDTDIAWTKRNAQQEPASVMMPVQVATESILTQSED